MRSSARSSSRPQLDTGSHRPWASRDAGTFAHLSGRGNDPPRALSRPMKEEKVVRRRLEELRAAFLTSDGTDPMHEKVGWIRALEWVLGRM